MKTAEERAADFINERCNGLFNPDGVVAMQLARSFKEYARDQRHLCAERVQDELAVYEHPSVTCDTAHNAVMNAPEPGKERR